MVCNVCTLLVGTCTGISCVRSSVTCMPKGSQRIAQLKCLLSELLLFPTTWSTQNEADGIGHGSNAGSFCLPFEFFGGVVWLVYMDYNQIIKIMIFFIQKRGFAFTHLWNWFSKYCIHGSIVCLVTLRRHRFRLKCRIKFFFFFNYLITSALSYA